jgi:protein-tyrosine-phosphatase
MMLERSRQIVVARSAGSQPKNLHPTAVQVMHDRGIDISGRPTKHFKRFAREHFDLVVTLCDKVKEVCPEFPGHPSRSHWSIADPANDAVDSRSSYETFVKTADEIEARVDLLIAQLVSLR